jgi:hypothetical protein
MDDCICGAGLDTKLQNVAGRRTSGDAVQMLAFVKIFIRGAVTVRVPTRTGG